MNILFIAVCIIFAIILAQFIGLLANPGLRYGVLAGSLYLFGIALSFLNKK
jgi:hypothetical protein